MNYKYLGFGLILTSSIITGLTIQALILGGEISELSALIIFSLLFVMWIIGVCLLVPYKISLKSKNKLSHKKYKEELNALREERKTEQSK